MKSEFVAVIATNSQIGVFDLASSDVIIMESGLKELLKSDKVVKVWRDLHIFLNLLQFSLGHARCEKSSVTIGS